MEFITVMIDFLTAHYELIMVGLVALCLLIPGCNWTEASIRKSGDSVKKVLDMVAHVVEKLSIKKKK